MPRKSLFNRYLRSDGPKLIANFSPVRRTRSILLDEVNPILHPREFQQRRIAPTSGKGKEKENPESEDHVEIRRSSSKVDWNPYCEQTQIS